MDEQNTTPMPNGSDEPCVEIKPSGANLPPEDALEVRRKLILSLPGKYRLISSEEYLREKHGETSREDR
jgi:hypothetical protein